MLHVSHPSWTNTIKNVFRMVILSHSFLNKLTRGNNKDNATNDKVLIKKILSRCSQQVTFLEFKTKKLLDK